MLVVLLLIAVLDCCGGGAMEVGDAQPAPAPAPEQVHSAGAGGEPLPPGWVRHPGKDEYGQEGFYYWNT